MIPVLIIVNETTRRIALSDGTPAVTISNTDNWDSALAAYAIEEKDGTVWQWNADAQDFTEVLQ